MDKKEALEIIKFAPYDLENLPDHFKKVLSGPIGDKFLGNLKSLPEKGEEEEE